MHNIEFYEYPEKVNKKQVRKELDMYVAHQDWQEGCKGLDREIRWLENKVYSNEEEAKIAINKLDNGWYDQLAVKYYSSNHFDCIDKNSKKEIKWLVKIEYHT